MLSQNEIKKVVGEKATQLIEQDSVIGIGSGTTVHYFIKELGRLVREGLQCKAIVTSIATQKLATAEGITTIELNDTFAIRVTIDGADETDEKLNLIKGGGGALLQEKMVAGASDQLVIIADHTKLVKTLGAFPLPVEVIPFGWKQVKKNIEESFRIKVALRSINGEPYITDHKHFILDCYFNTIQNPAELNISLHLIPGVVETGLFVNMASYVLLGYPDGSIRKLEK